jgi:hypothetical protein
MTNGPIKRANKPWQLGPFKTKKGIKKGRKYTKKSGSTFRDYRGIDGVLEDAQRKK